MKIGLFYGSTTCYTEIVAEKIQATMTEYSVDIYNIKNDSLDKTADYDVLIFGISTWDYGELQEDWESRWNDIATLDLSNKVIALYGMGDQIGYTEWFQDALGLLHEQVIAQDPYIIGFWPNQGYEFSASKGLTEDQKHFVGLSLDEDNQYDLTDERISLWCKKITQEINDIFKN